MPADKSYQNTKSNNTNDPSRYDRSAESRGQDYCPGNANIPVYPPIQGQQQAQPSQEAMMLEQLRANQASHVLHMNPNLTSSLNVLPDHTNSSLASYLGLGQQFQSHVMARLSANDSARLLDVARTQSQDESMRTMNVDLMQQAGMSHNPQQLGFPPLSQQNSIQSYRNIIDSFLTQQQIQQQLQLHNQNETLRQLSQLSQPTAKMPTVDSDTLLTIARRSTHNDGSSVVAVGPMSQATVDMSGMTTNAAAVDKSSAGDIQPDTTQSKKKSPLMKKKRKRDGHSMKDASIDTSVAGALDVGTTQLFPEKLYNCLVDAEQNGKAHIASFTPSGNAFKIHDRKAFLTDLSRPYFRFSTYSSFRRQLYIYNFNLVKSQPDEGAYHHAHFVKGRPELLHLVERTPYKSATEESGSGPFE